MGLNTLASPPRPRSSEADNPDFSLTLAKAFPAPSKAAVRCDSPSREAADETVQSGQQLRGEGGGQLEGGMVCRVSRFSTNFVGNDRHCGAAVGANSEFKVRSRVRWHVSPAMPGTVSGILPTCFNAVCRCSSRQCRHKLPESGQDLKNSSEPDMSTTCIGSLRLSDVLFRETREA